ncbi:MAG: response regulator [Chitinivibrionales bacterium]|nr:response regulator [Chitinivibrionales bacterium]
MATKRVINYLLSCQKSNAPPKNPGLKFEMATLNSQKVILFISVDDEFVAGIRNHIAFKSYEILHAHSSSSALAYMDSEEIDIVVLDIKSRANLEIDLVNYTRTRLPHAEIVILAEMHELEEASNAMRRGASLYLIKPVKIEDINAVLEKLSHRQDAHLEHLELQQRVLADLMAGSSVMEKTFKLAMKIAPTVSTVLIAGESGTGKEFFARIIHKMSRRADGRFVAMNCGAIPDTLFESELFGHKKGSFTGADRDKAGLVEEADLGTLLLDEVGELSPQAQVKLLRFLQERSFRRIGETRDRSVNVRIIAASNKDLIELIRHGSFREDLYYRLNVFNLHLAPLRKRKETIPNLVKLFVHRYNEITGKRVNKISKAAEAVMANYDYPGNVRELENIVEHAVVLAENNEITENDLPEVMFRNRLLLGPPAAAPDEKEIKSLRDVEKTHIAMVLERKKYNYTEVARLLGISRSTLWRKMKEYDLEQR